MTKARHTVPTRGPKELDDNNVTIIILGANVGYRMKSYGPQSMFKIGEKTLIEHQVEIIRKKLPRCDIILVTGYCADRVIKNRPNDVRIIENVLYEQTNEAEQLRLAFNNMITKTAIIIGADILFDFNTFKAAAIDQSCMLVDSKGMISKSNIGVTVVGGEVTIMNYSLPTKWCHIAVLTDRELKLVKALCNDKAHVMFYFSEILNMLLEKCPLKAIEPQANSISKLDSSELIL